MLQLAWSAVCSAPVDVPEDTSLLDDELDVSEDDAESIELLLDVEKLLAVESTNVLLSVDPFDTELDVEYDVELLELGEVGEWLVLP